MRLNEFCSFEINGEHILLTCKSDPYKISPLDGDMRKTRAVGTYYYG